MFTFPQTADSLDSQRPIEGILVQAGSDRATVRRAREKTLTAEIAARLEEARVAAGFETQQEFADKNQVPQSSYHQHEAGKRGLSFLDVVEYSEALGIRIEWLLTGAWPMRPKDRLIEFPTSMPTIQIEAIAKAGTWNEPDSGPAQPLHMHVPPVAGYAIEDQVAVIVAGTDHGKISGAIYLPLETAREYRLDLVAGREVVVHRTNGTLRETTLHEYSPAKLTPYNDMQGTRLDPNSEDVEIAGIVVWWFTTYPNEL